MSGQRAKQGAKKPVEDLDDYRDFGIEDEEPEDEIPEDYEDDDEEERPSREEVIPEEHDRVLDLEEIFAVTDGDEEEIYIPEWKGKVVIKSVSKREFDFMRRAARAKSARGRTNEILERELTIAGLVKPPLNQQSYERLLEKEAGPMLHILNEIYRKSGLEREAELARERRFPRK